VKYVSVEMRGISSSDPIYKSDPSPPPGNPRVPLFSLRPFPTAARTRSRVALVFLCTSSELKQNPAIFPTRGHRRRCAAGRAHGADGLAVVPSPRTPKGSGRGSTVASGASSELPSPSSAVPGALSEALNLIVVGLHCLASSTTSTATPVLPTVTDHLRVSSLPTFPFLSGLEIIERLHESIPSVVVLFVRFSFVF
jgi:hypothetical protein